MQHLFPTWWAERISRLAFLSLLDGGLMYQVRCSFLKITFGSPCVVFTGELRLAARTLFDAGVAGLTDEETTSLVERWQHSCTVLVLHRLVFELIWTVIQCRFYFRTLKDDHLSPQRVCCSVDLLQLVNTDCSLQGDILKFDFFNSVLMKILS